MCGRYTIALDLNQALAEMNLDLPEFDFEPRFNIAPSQRLPVILDEAPQKAQLLKWGLVPFWAKDPKIGYKMINALGETVHEKPSFRNAFKRRRCLILADGFYEWQKRPDGKQPHHIHLKNRELMTFAGLWESWRDAEEREMRTFTIITTTPNVLMEPLHNRMPTIIAPEDRSVWLAPESNAETLRSLIQPYAADQMEALPVSTQVNNVRNDAPELIDPIEA